MSTSKTKGSSDLLAEPDWAVVQKLGPPGIGVRYRLNSQHRYYYLRSNSVGEFGASDTLLGDPG